MMNENNRALPPQWDAISNLLDELSILHDQVLNALDIDEMHQALDQIESVPKQILELMQSHGEEDRDA